MLFDAIAPENVLKKDFTCVENSIFGSGLALQDGSVH